MTDYNKLNRELSDKAEEAREVARLAACKALAVARKCRKTEGSEVAPEIKAEASALGKEAWAARKAAREASAESATARRIACFKALPAKAVPEIDKAALPLKPPSAKRAWEE